MKEYKFIEHTADVFIESKGKDFKEALEALAEGLMKLMVENYKEIKCKEKREIEVESEDEKALIFDFLTEILFLHDAENLVFSKVEIKELKENKLKAELCGDVFDPKVHKENVAVKAVTYHEMEIKKKENGVTIKVLVDI